MQAIPSLTRSHCSSANGVSASLSIRDDSSKPRLLRLTETKATPSTASASATTDFHRGNQWIITWQDSEQGRQGLVSLCAESGKVEAEPEWCQGSLGGFYLASGKCGELSFAL